MGNYRFKLSGMMPSAWFYKLRDMGRARNKKHTTHHSHKKNQSSSSSTTQLSKPKQAHQFNARKSYYFTRELNPKVSHSSCHEPPRKPSKRTPNNRTPMIKSYSLPGHSSSPFDSSTESEFPKPEFRTDSLLLTEAFHQTVSWPSKSCSRSGLNYTADDIVIDVDKSSTDMKDVKLSLNGYVLSSDFEPPLITIKKKETKPRSRMSTHEEPNTQNSLEVKTVKEDAASIKGQRITHINRLTVSSPGVKLRTNAPRTRKIQIQTHDGRSVSSSSASSSRSTRRIWDSLAIAKRSWDPETDFRESMVEMIVENKMRASKDLEDLLARYLYLNSEEYHELIIKVFKQIWSDLRDTR